MRAVVVLFGPPGAGKSTVAQTRPAGWQLFDYDTFVWLGESGREEPSRSSKGRAFSRELTALGRRHDALAVVVRVGANPDARRRCIHQTHATHVYRVDPGESVCLRRLAVRSGEVSPYQRKGVNEWYRNGAGLDVPAWPGVWPAAGGGVGEW